MALVNILHMNIGYGDSSYASNSFLQEEAIQKMIPILKHTIKGMANHDVFFDRCFMIADLGCSSGSFYDRLFPDESLHFVYSSYSVQWLSQVPEGLENNKFQIYVTKTSPVEVLHAYRNQFHTDFTKFLQLRSKEIVRGGRMFLILPGGSTADPTSDECCCLWELLAISLVDMLKEGLVQESDINSFNIPFYFPCDIELRNIIQNEGSFSLDIMNAFEVNYDPHDNDYIDMNHSHSLEENTTKLLRAFTEPLLTSHFGNSIIDMLFKKYGKHVAELLAIKKPRQFSFVISLTKK